MAVFTVGSGIDNYISDLNTLLADEETCLGRAIFEGAKIVADKCRAEISSLPVEETGRGKKDRVSGITQSQKNGLLEGLGIAHMRRDGEFINVKIGMDGYNSTVTKKYPKGQPNAMIIRSLEAGTSFRSRNAVITRAVNSSRGAAEAAMKKQLDEEIKKRIH